MKLYTVTLGDTEGCDNIDGINVLAESFDEALDKAKTEMATLLSDIRKEEVADKTPKKDRLPEGYSYVVESIVKCCEIDVT